MTLASDQEEEDKRIIKAGVLSNVLNFDSIFVDGSFGNWPNGYVREFIAAVCLKNDLDMLFKAHHFSIQENLKARIEISAIRLSVLEGADISSWKEFASFESHPISQCLRQIERGKFEIVSVIAPDADSSQHSINNENISHQHWFFSCLATRFLAEGDFCWLPVKSMEGLVDTSSNFELLANLSCKVAEHICLSENKTISFFEASFLLPNIDLEDSSGFDERRAIIWLKRDWLEIVADCHLLTTKRPIELDELNSVIESEIFLLEWIQLWYIDVGQSMLSLEATKQLIELEYNRQKEKLEVTIERSNILGEEIRTKF